MAGAEGRRGEILHEQGAGARLVGTRGVPTPFSIAIEDYELCHEHRPKEHEDEQDIENWTGVRLYEKAFALYGTEKLGEPISAVEDRLRAEASVRRQWS